MSRQSLLPTDYHSQSSIRVYRSRLSLLLLPLSIVILFVIISSYNSNELESIREMKEGSSIQIKRMDGIPGEVESIETSNNEVEEEEKKKEKK
ncbi:hypothetical protein PENTCL1PPCAC_17999, partial [Pristionchus entomophagus]